MVFEKYIAVHSSIVWASAAILLPAVQAAVTCLTKNLHIASSVAPSWLMRRNLQKFLSSCHQ
jgi:hypothetical protein